AAAPLRPAADDTAPPVSARYPAPNDHGHDSAAAIERVESAGRRDPTSARKSASSHHWNDDRPIFLARHVVVSLRPASPGPSDRAATRAGPLEGVWSSLRALLLSMAAQATAIQRPADWTHRCPVTLATTSCSSPCASGR